MTKERYQRGWKRLIEVDGEGGKRIIESLKDVAFTDNPCLFHFLHYFNMK